MGCKYAFGTLTLVRWWIVMVMVMAMVWDTRGDVRESEWGRGGMDVMSN